MNTHNGLIKKETIVETVQLLEQKIKTYQLDQLEEKIKDGVSVGEYVIHSTSLGYDIHLGKYSVCKNLYSLDTAFLIVQVKLKSPHKNISDIVKADHEYGKYKYDTLVYSNTIATSDNMCAVMVAEDRLNEAVDRMKDAKKILSKLRIDINAPIFDK